MYSTITELKSAISAETARANASFTDQFDAFIARAEQRIFLGNYDFGPLRCREMETRLALSFTDGVATLPDDYLEARRLTWEADPTRILRYREPEEFYGRQYGSSYDGGYPWLFTIEGSAIELRPITTGTATLAYYARPITVLTSSGVPIYDATGAQVYDELNEAILLYGPGTNAVLRAYGEVYLFAALIEAYTYLRNAEKASESVDRYKSAVMGVNLASAKARYAGTRLAPRIPGAVQ